MSLMSIATTAMGVMASTGADPSGGSIPGQLGGAIGLLNYGVLGILTLGFIRGWVVSPRERERLVADLTELKKENSDKDLEIARLNTVMQENLQAMVATTDKQIELWSRQERARSRDSGSGSGSS